MKEKDFHTRLTLCDQGMGIFPWNRGGNFKETELSRLSLAKPAKV
jgi:hypothetical protein